MARLPRPPPSVKPALSHGCRRSHRARRPQSCRQPSRLIVQEVDGAATTAAPAGPDGKLTAAAAGTADGVPVLLWHRCVCARRSDQLFVSLDDKFGYLGLRCLLRSGCWIGHLQSRPGVSCLQSHTTLSAPARSRRFLLPPAVMVSRPRLPPWSLQPEVITPSQATMFFLLLGSDCMDAGADGGLSIRGTPSGLPVWPGLDRRGAASQPAGT